MVLIRDDCILRSTLSLSRAYFTTTNAFTAHRPQHLKSGVSSTSEHLLIAARSLHMRRRQEKQNIIECGVHCDLLIN
jgi:hypothetical protein